MARGRRDRTRQIDIWPGFVDALSTLLMAIIFLLVVYVLAQFVLSRLLQGRDADVGRLQSQVQELTDQLESEVNAASDLRRSLARLNADLAAAVGERDDLRAALNEGQSERDQAAERLGLLDDEQRLLQRNLDESRLAQQEAERRAASLRAELDEARKVVTADKAAIEAQLAELVQLRRDIDALKTVRAQLEADVAAKAASLAQTTGQVDELNRQLTAVRDQSSALEARLSTEQERTALAQKELAERQLRIEDLTRQATELQQQRDAASSAQATASASNAELIRQVAALSDQLRRLDAALGSKQEEIDRQSTTIADLGRQLNTALASKVEELSQFRSEFFGRLRRVLGDRTDVRIVGDRFVLQSEVLFDSGTADIGANGRAELTKLAATLKEITEQIPSELPWVLQVDGHTDIRPISTPRFPSNWELSTARAISVARFLVSQGIPSERVAATGFAEFQPLDPGRTEEALRRNRRIEIKLTTR
ncbi:MAG: peptidoglycan -binding protein [Geminicoccaceae bacterium]